MHFQNGSICSPTILTPAPEPHTLTFIVRTALAPDLALKYCIFFSALQNCFSGVGEDIVLLILSLMLLL